MPFNKIQPEQIQMPTFFSDSGDLNISQVSDTGVQINVSRNLTGDFSFSGQLLTDGREVFGMPNNIDSNTFDSKSGNLLFKGVNTEIGADASNNGNLALYSVNGDISGVRNVVVRGSNTTFNTGSQDNVILAGNSITFATEATGCVAIKDNLSSPSMLVNKQHSLNIQFKSGTYINGGNTYIGESLSVQSSGTISGDLRCLGSNLFSGISEFGGASTQSTTFHNTARFKTGFAIPLWSGNGSQAGTNAQPATGALAISGATLLIYTGHGNLQGWGHIGIGTNA
jgi:hypothetical protein